MQTDTTYFTSPFDQLPASYSQLPKCQPIQNYYPTNVQTQWQPAFPIDEIQKLSPPLSAFIKQSSQGSSSQESSQSHRSDYSYVLDELSPPLQDFSLSSQALDIELGSDNNNQDEDERAQIERGGNNTITNDLMQVYQYFTQEGKGKVLSSKKQTHLSLNEGRKEKQDKVVAAMAFINRGYGINQLKEQLRTGNYGSLKIDECRYKSVAGSMVRQSFRNLQAFLLRDCKQKLHNMAGYEMKLLQTLLLNCRTTLPPLHSQYFMQIVRITYNISDTAIHQNECLQLYKSIHRALNKKIAILRGQRLQAQSYSLDERPRRDSLRISYSGQVDSAVITANVEREIIAQYINVQSLSQVRDSVRRRFKIDQSKLNVKVIRNILRRVMRATIRKIEHMLADRRIRINYGQQRMSDQLIKSILQTAAGGKLRNKLCRLHLSECRDIQQAEQIGIELYHFSKHAKIARIELD